MENETNCCEKKCCSAKIKKCKGGSGQFCGGVYFFAFIGAAVYFVQSSTGFWMGVLGILKAIAWPALLIHKVFVLIGM